ncbi:tetratricopeptide repeat protein [Oceanivirga miroungae]|uniref:Beta-barrel assembly-enhancing protease n=1 Tax=Oceanivirga miroungae TaxID=1130046 RepID=A0A6I8M7L7_9FUSO|nr:tetratricopeptide repeat protein [Oceanivirga miroungae]VWL84810.1 Beta-barrel assembly-enhancing protease [Oceanivirga miroungae]
MLQTLVFREYRYDKNIDNRIEKLKENINQNENDIESLKELANIYHAHKKNSEAVLMYEKLSKILYNDNEVLAFLGYLYYENNDLDNAKKYLLKALELYEKEPFVLFLLGNTVSRQGKIIDAINYYEKAIFLDFDILTAHIDFGRKYEHMGRHKKAYKEYLAAYELDKSDDGLKEKIDYLKEKIEKIQ